MHALWASLRGAVHCRGKRPDVIQGEERPVKRRTCTQPRNSDDDEELTQQHTRNWFYILEIGDPSRNVVEMILRATTTATDTARCSIKIKQVLKLNNSRETLERFERFREAVKNRAFEHYNKKHPRNMVDGNEQLLFYGTKVTCCRGKPFGVSKLCKDSNCSTCRIIQSGFYTAQKKTGIWLSTNCQDFINDDANAERQHAKRAIMVCRVIAGRVINMLDKDYEGGYDSIGGVKSNYLLAKDPSAVLPCFVIILN